MKEETAVSAEFKETLMGIRTASGAAYVAVLVGFFFLRSVNPLFFSAFIWFLSFMGAFEVARAVKNFSVKGGFVFAVIFGASFVPVYETFELLFSCGVIAALIFTALYIALIGAYSIIEKQKSKAFAVAVLTIVYPAVLLLFILAINGFSGEKGLIALILLFVISPCADVFAYLTGMTYNKIRKGKAKKLCPVLSPKKTVAGALGGVLGGAAGGLIVYFIFKETANAIIGFMPAAIYFALIGVFGSVLTEIGDLFESGIKRKVGIKDMGKIMPGHGGVMDRIDGTLFCAVLVCLSFSFV